MTQEKSPKGKPWLREIFIIVEQCYFKFTAFCLEKRTTTKNHWIRKYLENRVGQQNDMRLFCLEKRAYTESAVRLYGNRTELSIQLYGNFRTDVRNFSVQMYETVRNCPYTVRTKKFRNPISSRKMCKFSKFVQKLFLLKNYAKNCFGLLPLIPETLFLTKLPGNVGTGTCMGTGMPLFEIGYLGTSRGYVYIYIDINIL